MKQCSIPNRGHLVIENSQTSESFILNGLARLRQGDVRAQDELIAYAEARFRSLASRMLKEFPRVKRWEQTDDILQTALVKLHGALKNTQPQDRQHFLRLSTLQIRRTLVDLARHYQGAGWKIEDNAPQDLDATCAPGQDAERFVDTNEPSTLEDWTAFHEAVAKLPEQERDVFELLWYQGLSQLEASAVLEVTERTVRRYWTSARLRLSEMLKN